MPLFDKCYSKSRTSTEEVWWRNVSMQIKNMQIKSPATHGTLHEMRMGLMKMKGINWRARQKPASLADFDYNLQWTNSPFDASDTLILTFLTTVFLPADSERAPATATIIACNSQPREGKLLVIYTNLPKGTYVWALASLVCWSQDFCRHPDSRYLESTVELDISSAKRHNRWLQQQVLVTGRHTQPLSLLDSVNHKCKLLCKLGHFWNFVANVPDWFARRISSKYNRDISRLRDCIMDWKEPSTSGPLPTSFTAVNTGVSAKERIDVAVLIDTTIKSVPHQDHRQEALEIIIKTCNETNARVNQINFKRLDFGEASVVDQFYSSDAAIVDLSIPDQQSALLYHLAVRESFGMKNNILLFNEVNTVSGNSCRELKSMLQSLSQAFLSYRLVENTDVQPPIKNVILTETGDDSLTKNTTDAKSLLYNKLKRLLQEVEVQTKAHMKEKFLSDLRKARETYTGQELAHVLHNLRKRLDEPNMISNEVVHSMMLSFREIQDYDAMVQLIEDLESVANFNFMSTPAILNYYAFALNRRNRKGDREKALAAITTGLKNKENVVPDIVCLCGRIYKDMFTESDYTDKDALNQAIEWYRKGFGIQQSEYAGINLATLLVVAGNNFKESRELQRIGLILSSLIGRKGALNTLQDYWDVAIFFEISVLAENYARAIQVSICFEWDSFWRIYSCLHWWVMIMRHRVISHVMLFYLCLYLLYPDSLMSTGCWVHVQPETSRLVSQVYDWKHTFDQKVSKKAWDGEVVGRGRVVWVLDGVLYRCHSRSGWCKGTNQVSSSSLWERSSLLLCSFLRHRESRSRREVSPTH